MNFRFSLNDFSYGEIKIGALDINVEYTAEEAATLAKTYSELLPSIMTAITTPNLANTTNRWPEAA